MKIVLMEPLNVEAALIEELAQPLKEAGHDFVYYDEKTTDVDEMIERSQDADILMIANNPLPAEVIKANDQLKLINVAFTGYDHVDVAAAQAQGVKVANAAGYSDDAVAELVIGLVLNLYRQIKQGDQNIRKGQDFPGPHQGKEIKGKTVGIIGTGKIGSRVAQLFHAFGANLLGYNRSEKEEMKKLGMTYVSLDDLVKDSDIISLHLPNNEETRGLIDGHHFDLMRETAIFINAARGPIVDNQALAQALNAGEIAGAGIDVFDGEPPLDDDYPLLHADGALLTPHVAFLTDEAMVDRAHIAFNNTQAFIDGKPQNIVLD